MTSPDPTGPAAPAEAKPIAVVLASGGMDSCVTLAIAARSYRPALLHVNYGQRTETRELQAFRDIAAHYGVPEAMRMTVSIEHLARIGGSSLTDRSIAVNDASAASVGAGSSGVADAAGIPATYVPFRNANLLGIAVSWAEVLGAAAVFIGAVEEDSSGYPDCRRAFYEAFQRVIDTGTKAERPLRVMTPLIALSKAEIVREGIALGAPLELTWSCYREEERACGRCDSCVLRLRGFARAGVPDPLPYSAHPGAELLR